MILLSRWPIISLKYIRVTYGKIVFPFLWNIYLVTFIFFLSPIAYSQVTKIFFFSVTAFAETWKYIKRSI
jgi:hypothetical protein